MGIESREYLRDEDDPSSGSPRRSAPMSIVTKIILVNVAVFLLQVFTSSQDNSPLETWLALENGPLFHGQVWRLLTYAFLHDRYQLLHIVFNMYVLYVLGRMTVQLTGEREFPWFYCTAAVFAGICSIVFYTIMNVNVICVGASGAVLAVFCLLAMHYPRMKLYLFGVLGVEMRWLLAIYTAIDALPIARALMTNQMSGSGTAHSAHLGGLIFGWLYFRWHMRITSWLDRLWQRSPARRARKAGLRVFNPPTQPEPDLSKRVDEILAKISEHGEESLTDRERKILRQASERLKRKH